MLRNKTFYNKLLRYRFFLFGLLVVTGFKGTITGQPLPQDSSRYSFIFITDTHINTDSTVSKHFREIVRTANRLHPDFILTGGDMVGSALSANESTAISLFSEMKSLFSYFTIPVYYTMGNHDMFGVYAESGVSPDNPLWGKKMFEAEVGKRYYTFMHKGWKFIVLDGTQITGDRKYTGGFDKEQIQWLKDELKNTDKATPLIVSNHIPFVNPNNLLSDTLPVMTKPYRSVLDLFEGYNLKLVLQGHSHEMSDVLVRGIHFLSGGTTIIQKNNIPEKEGFLLINIDHQAVKWEFVSTAGITF
jgi:predicted MPP superfamily phosphohydrolase